MRVRRVGVLEAKVRRMVFMQMEEMVQKITAGSRNRAKQENRYK